MQKFLSSLTNAVMTGFLLALLLLWMGLYYAGGMDHAFATFIMRWLHVLSGVMWIGLLWYFNFVQIPNMPSIPDEQKPAIGKVIAPAALWWFRWGAMATIATGLLLAWMSGYFVNALTLDGFSFLSGEVDVPKDLSIGIGMWLGIIMWANVWFVIWPKQRIALGIDPSATPEMKPPAAATAAMFSRINTVLSIPMLFAMVSAQNIY